MTSPLKKRRPPYWRRRLIVAGAILAPLALWFLIARGADWLRIDAEGNAPRLAQAGPIYILVMGVDERTEDRGRSDTLILLRLNRAPDRIDLVSLPRDTRINLQGAVAKLNQAYGSGGADQATAAVAQLLAIPRPYYVKVNLQAFERIIDQLGGVEMTLDRAYYYEDPYQDLVIDLKPGRQVLSGARALGFVRLRYDGVTNDDIARIGRQQQFITALKARFAEPSSWVAIPRLITTMRAHVATNLPTADQLPLAQALFEARGNIRMQTLPGVPDDESGDWLLDLTQWNEVKASWRPN